jgi:hypothetical protein
VLFVQSLEQFFTGNQYVRVQAPAWQRKILRETILQTTTMTRFFSETGHQAPFMVRNVVLKNIDKCYGA